MAGYVTAATFTGYTKKVLITAEEFRALLERCAESEAALEGGR